MFLSTLLQKLGSNFPVFVQMSYLTNTHQFLSPVLRAQEDRKVKGLPNDRREQEGDREGRR